MLVAAPLSVSLQTVSEGEKFGFDVRRSPSLPDAVRARLEKLAGSRLTLDGVLILTAQAHRSQERNRQDARDRLIALIRQAAVAPIPRRPTKPTLGSKLRRLEAKGVRSTIKKLRGPAKDD